MAICKICGRDNYNSYYGWCKSCQINHLRENFKNWTSGNEEVNKLIQEMQLKIDSYSNIVFEWIPYDQLDDIKGNSMSKLCLAMWKDGPLVYDGPSKEYIRIPNKNIALKHISNSQDIAVEIDSYSIKFHATKKIVFGISQNPDTKDYIMVFEDGYCENCKLYIRGVTDVLCELCQINYFEKNFTDCANENEKIDNLIQKIQSKYHLYNGIVFEWIPYNQFNNIKEMDVYDFTKIYLAVWENGPSYHNSKDKYIRNKNRNKKVKLKSLCNLQNITDEFLNVDKSYTDCILYGISQAPGTKDYIIIFQDEYCEKCNQKYTNGYIKLCTICQYSQYSLFSGNEIIDELIQEMQLKINSHYDIVFEWIPYSELDDIKKIGEGEVAVEIYSAIWKNGLLYYDYSIREYKRTQNKKVTLKYLYNSQNVTNVFINKIKAYGIYGISQHPETKDYVIVFHQYNEEKCTITMDKKILTNWTSGNEIIDKLIQEMQLKVISHNGIVFEWIPYSQLDDIKKIGEGDFAAEVYSAIWKNGLLYYDYSIHEYKRIRNKEVTLKYLYNSQNVTNVLINKIKAYPIYGISQHPETKDYVIVFQYSEEKCTITMDKKILTNWTSGNDNIDELIQEMQSRINSNDDIVFESVPYSQFDNIKEIGQGGFAKVYSAIWKNGPLYYNSSNEYIRIQNKKVALKCLHNSQNISNKFLNEVKAYSIKKYDDYAGNNVLKIFGISQNPNTKDYIMVLDYAKGGNFDHWADKNYRNFGWSYKLTTLWNIIKGLKEIHQKQMVHNDFHTGNILLNVLYVNNLNDNSIYISDMGLCGKVDDIDQNNIYGVMPYVAPEILKGKLYTQAADIYSFGMIMYFVGTGKQPFSDCAHDQYLALNICNGIRPEINEPEIPKCYGELMKRCWDSNPANRPKIVEILELIDLFFCSYKYDKFAFTRVVKIKKEQQHYEIEKQYKDAEEYRKSHLTPFDENKRLTTHPQAFYTSRLLNPFTKDLPKDDNIGNNSVEVFDFTNDE